LLNYVEIYNTIFYTVTSFTRITVSVWKKPLNSILLGKYQQYRFLFQKDKHRFICYQEAYRSSSKDHGKHGIHSQTKYCMCNQHLQQTVLSSSEEGANHQCQLRISRLQEKTYQHRNLSFPLQS